MAGDSNLFPTVLIGFQHGNETVHKSIALNFDPAGPPSVFSQSEKQNL